MDNNYGSENINLINLFLNMYWGNITSRTNPNIEQKHEETLKLLELFKKQNPNSIQKYNRVREILENMYNLLKNLNVIDEIKLGKVAKSDFFRQHREEIFGDNKRIYNMRDLYHRGVLANSIRNPKMKLVGFKECDSRIEHEYRDSNDTLIRITPLGNLEFQESNGVRSFMTKYRIQKEIENDCFIEYVVFSYIVISMMENLEYRKLVLDELLSENNINLSGCEGYIGKIMKEPKLNEDDLTLSEKKDYNGYTFRLSDNYVLGYETPEVTAVIEYSIMEQNKKIEKQKEIDEYR